MPKNKHLEVIKNIFLQRTFRGCPVQVYSDKKIHEEDNKIISSMALLHKMKYKEYPEGVQKVFRGCPGGVQRVFGGCMIMHTSASKEVIQKISFIALSRQKRTNKWQISRLNILRLYLMPLI